MLIHIYMGVSLYWPLSVFCVFVCLCLCVISNQSTSKKPYVLDLSKHDALLHKTHSKVLLVLRYQGLTQIHNIIKWCTKYGVVTFLAKDTRQQKKQWRWRLETTGKGEEFGQNLRKWEGWWDGNVGGFHKIGEIRKPPPAIGFYLFETKYLLLSYISLSIALHP